jgi:cation diffusion facilitator family transporter
MGGEAVQRQTLWWLLAINGAMFVLELVTGWLAESMGLIGDSLDMLADAAVYGVALWAVGSTNRRKTHAAFASGVLQVGLAVGVAVEVIRRAVAGSEPVSALMIGISLVALVANAACVMLLRKHRDGEIHMQASWIFSTTDVQVNVAVIVAGILVMITGAAWPDLVIASLVCAIVVRGGIRILRRARAAYAEERRAGSAAP